MRFTHMLRAYAGLRAQLVTEKDGDEEQGTGQVGSTGNYSCTDCSGAPASETLVEPE